MCPACFTAAALIAGSVTSTGGLAAIVINKFGAQNSEDKNAADKNRANQNPAPTPSKEDDHV
jgi:hypothetical protein